MIARFTAIALAISMAAPAFAGDANLPPPTVRESIAHVSVEYTEARVANGDRVRLIVTRPDHATGPLPVAFLVGWLSCDSVSWPGGPPFGLAQAWIQVARESGYMTVRMEKPGVGDSRGPPCATLDFTRELEAYRAAYATAAMLPGADARRIVLVGMSNGGGFAPLVPGSTKPMGYVVLGGWVKTWYEHMLEYERRRLTFLGSDAGAISAAMAHYEVLYELYLIEGLAPGEVLRRRPELRGDWQDAEDGQYGRPAAFFQQLQRLDLAGAWSHVDVPVLAMHGEYDYIMGADDHREIVRLAQANGAKASRYEELPETSHLMEVLASPRQAVDGSGPYNASAGAEIVRWLRDRAGVAASRWNPEGVQPTSDLNTRQK